MTSIGLILLAIIFMFIPACGVTYWILVNGIQAIIPTVPFWGKILAGVLLAGPVLGVVIIPFYLLVMILAWIYSCWETKKTISMIREEVKKH